MKGALIAVKQGAPGYAVVLGPGAGFNLLQNFDNKGKVTAINK